MYEYFDTKLAWFEIKFEIPQNVQRLEVIFLHPAV